MPCDFLQAVCAKSTIRNLYFFSMSPKSPDYLAEKASVRLFDSMAIRPSEFIPQLEEWEELNADTKRIAAASLGMHFADDRLTDASGAPTRRADNEELARVVKEELHEWQQTGVLSEDRKRLFYSIFRSLAPKTELAPDCGADELLESLQQLLKGRELPPIHVMLEKSDQEYSALMRVLRGSAFETIISGTLKKIGRILGQDAEFMERCRRESHCIQDGSSATAVLDLFAEKLVTFALRRSPLLRMTRCRKGVEERVHVHLTRMFKTRIEETFGKKA